MYASYRRICGPDGLLSKMQPFTGHSMWAEREDQGDYVVYSYSTEIARVRAGGAIIIDPARYSRTTSKHQHYVRAWL